MAGTKPPGLQGAVKVRLHCPFLPNLLASRLLGHQAAFPPVSSVTCPPVTTATPRSSAGILYNLTPSFSLGASPQTGVPEGRAMFPPSDWAPQAGLCLPTSDWGSLKARLCLSLRLGFLRAELCLPLKPQLQPSLGSTFFMSLHAVQRRAAT